MSKTFRTSMALILLFAVLCGAESAGKKPEADGGGAAPAASSAPAAVPAQEKKKVFGEAFLDEGNVPGGGVPKWLGGAERVSKYEISQNEKRLIASEVDGSIAVYDDKRKKLWKRRREDLGIKRGWTNLKTNYSGDRVVVFHADPQVRGGEYAPSFEFIVLNGEGREVFRGECGTPEERARGDGLCYHDDSAKISPNGRYLGMHGLDYNTLNFYDLQTGGFWQRPSSGLRLTEIHNNGNFAVDSGTVVVLYSRSGEMLKKVELPRGLYPEKAFRRDPDGSMIIE